MIDREKTLKELEIFEKKLELLEKFIRKDHERN
jgi:hypothetical protein